MKVMIMNDNNSKDQQQVQHDASDAFVGSRQMRREISTRLEVIDWQRESARKSEAIANIAHIAVDGLIKGAKSTKAATDTVHDLYTYITGLDLTGAQRKGLMAFVLRLFEQLGDQQAAMELDKALIATKGPGRPERDVWSIAKQYGATFDAAVEYIKKAVLASHGPRGAFARFWRETKLNGARPPRTTVDGWVEHFDTPDFTKN